MISTTMNSKIKVQKNVNGMSHPLTMEILYCIYNEMKIITPGYYLITPQQL